MTDNYPTVSLEVAKAIADQLVKNPRSLLGLPTGRTPIGCYEILSQWSRQGKLDWSQAHCFALDDYLDTDDEHTFAYYLEQHLYKHTNLPVQNRFNPRFFDNYDQLIADMGGLDLTIIGIGSNGHIAFNEPGTVEASWTHCTWLTESTRKSNASLFESDDKVPRLGVTMGISTILGSHHIILIASGEKKRDILIRAFQGPITTDVPASLLQGHRNVRIIADFELHV